MRCIESCPRHNIQAQPDKRLMTAASVTAIAGLYYVGTVLPTNTSTITTTQVSTKSYTNGTYTGSGQGFRGTTTVKVVVKNHKIASITVTSYQDDKQYFSQAKSSIIPAVISSQSTDVSTVSGATYSIKGLIEAIENALSNKSNSSSSTDASSNDSADSSTSSNDSSTNDSSDSLDFKNLKDGTYTGSGTGLRGTTSVKVVVKNKKVQSITVTSYEDDQQYFEAAKSTVINNIIKAQFLDVDGVSGATFSSNSIKEAVAKALSITYTNPNSSMSDGGEHHHGFH
jgi:uncharacterized protein with FMN-binding domain